ncbi:MAG: DUF2330 domain-containing protein [Myxococcales bacterium]|nr:DUF2330 domain-containing protein [Myxococcales bacterium]
MKRFLMKLLFVQLGVGLVMLSSAPHARACGCLSPPAPALNDDDFAVNQQAEQIIFEVGNDGYITAHVLIRYAGKPDKFAWIVPVPNKPELALTPASVFGLLDDATKPAITVTQKNVCPQSEYKCNQHPYPDCDPPNAPNPNNIPFADAGAASDSLSGNTSPPPVNVIDRQVIGSYDTVTFSAGDTTAAVAWLQKEGFIVNSSMAPYMQPYADAGMLFVASKLIPGADTSEIKPLRMRYKASEPMIPLYLTAVAAEPHMAIQTYIFGDKAYQPKGLPLVSLDSADLSMDNSGRNNYPMLLSRAIDKAGGKGFVAEFSGAVPLPDFDKGTGCCDSGFDQCGVQFDGVCSCPNSPFDQEDCKRDQPDLLEGLKLLQELQSKHKTVTRLITRMSPHEMTNDPGFEAVPSIPLSGRLTLSNAVNSLANCTNDVMDKKAFDQLTAKQACATTYCGQGECVVTQNGAGCVCKSGYTARTITDLDGKPSVTCVPDKHTVDLTNGGALALPDACKGVACGSGASCLDVGGFPTCQCKQGDAAALPTTADTRTPVCRPVEGTTSTPGAQDYSAPLAKLAVCAPPPPNCGKFGWLEKIKVDRPGVICDSSATPTADRFVVPPKPTCGDLNLPPAGYWKAQQDKGCSVSSGSPSGTAVGVLALLLLAVVTVGARRRRRRRR